MTIKRKKRYIYVKADEGKILVYNGVQFDCANMPLDTDTNEIMEIDKPSEEDVTE